MLTITTQYEFFSEDVMVSSMLVIRCVYILRKSCNLTHTPHQSILHARIKSAMKLLNTKLGGELSYAG